MIPTVKRQNMQSEYAAQCVAGGVIAVAPGTSVADEVGGELPLGHVALMIVALLIAYMVEWSRPHIVAWPVLSSQFGLSVLAQS